MSAPNSPGQPNPRKRHPVMTAILWSALVVITGMVCFFAGQMKGEAIRASAPTQPHPNASSAAAPTSTMPNTAVTPVPSTPAPTASPTPTDTGLMEAYTPAPGSCEYRVTDVTDQTEPTLWVRSTNPYVCTLMAQTGQVFAAGEGFITLTQTALVPAPGNEAVLNHEDSNDAAGNTIPNSVFVVARLDQYSSGADQLDNRAQLVGTTIANATATTTPVSGKSLDTSSDQSGTFYLVGNGKGEIAPGTWISTGIPVQSSACQVYVFKSAKAYNQGLADNNAQFTSEIGGGLSPVGGTDISLSITLSAGNPTKGTPPDLVFATGDCLWKYTGAS